MVEHMLVHDNRLVQELLLLQTDPETCQEEIGVTLLAHSGTYMSIPIMHYCNDHADHDMQERCL